MLDLGSLGGSSTERDGCDCVVFVILTNFKERPRQRRTVGAGEERRRPHCLDTAASVRHRGDNARYWGHHLQRRTSVRILGDISTRRVS